jgi:hypothetical protein
MTPQPAASTNPWETSERVERLLEAIHTEVTQGAWQHIDEMVRGLLSLYGAGLSRAIDVARHAGAPEGPLQEGLLADDLVSSLLLLHGMHPHSPEERIRRSLRRLEPHLAAQQLSVSLQRVDEDGVAHLRVEGADDGRTRALSALRGALQQAVEDAAPEVVQVSLEGLPDGGSGLVQLRMHTQSAERGGLGASL